MEKLFDWAEQQFEEDDIDGPVFFALGAARAAARNVKDDAQYLMIHARLKDIEAAFLRSQLLWEGRK